MLYVLCRALFTCRAVGQEHERRLANDLERLRVSFVDEARLRKLDYDKTPDVTVDPPIGLPRPPTSFYQHHKSSKSHLDS